MNTSNRSLCLAAALILVAAACRQPQRPLIVLGEQSSNLDALRTLSEGYEALTGVPVEFEGVPFSVLQERSAADLSQHTGRYDVILQYNFTLAEYARKRLTYTLPELRDLASLPFAEIDADLFRDAWMEVGFYYATPSRDSADLVELGYPFAANTMLLVYNESMFQDRALREAYAQEFGRLLDVPETWADFLQVARFLSASSPDRFGVVLQGASGGWLYYEWVNFLFGMGGRVMDKPHGWMGDSTLPTLLDQPEAMRALEAYVSLKAANYGGFFGIDAAQQRDLLLTGRAGMAIVWSDYVFDLVKAAKETGLALGFAPIPGDVSMLAGGAFYVNRDSKQAKAAADFVSYALRPENQAAMMLAGLCSPNRKAYADPRVSQLAYADALRRSLERGVYMVEAGPDADLIQQVISENIERVWRGELSPEEGVTAMQRRLDDERPKLWSLLEEE